MVKVLIGRNEIAARNNKEVLNNLVKYLQTIYNGFADVNIKLSLDELVKFVNEVRYNSQYSVAAFVKNKLVDEQGPVSFGGITLDKQKLKELIQLPDLETLEAAKLEAQSILSLNGTGYKLRDDLVQMSASGTISKSKDADTIIDAEFTYHTATANGAKLVETAKTLCDALNNWIKVSGDNFHVSNYTGIKGLKKDEATQALTLDIPYFQNRDK